MWSSLQIFQVFYSPTWLKCVSKCSPTSDAKYSCVSSLDYAFGKTTAIENTSFKTSLFIILWYIQVCFFLLELKRKLQSVLLEVKGLILVLCSLRRRWNTSRVTFKFQSAIILKRWSLDNHFAGHSKFKWLNQYWLNSVLRGHLGNCEAR